MSRAWLVEQLPQSLRDERVVAAIVTAGQDVADSLRHQMNAFDAQVDPRTATPAMLSYMAAWFGFTLDLDDDEELLRRLVARLGPIVLRRGTRDALQELAELLTGGPVRVVESGYVVGPRQTPPPDVTDGMVVRVEVSTMGPMGADRLRAILAREVPVGVTLELTERGPRN
ncbi:phage tail protein [Propionibacteriaceae bacterium Y2011]|uniref:phage tail protein n=1 Tax=Microlunatus sp. Y2014 TaxID=3418488 RepID=UPI003B470C09